MTLAENSARSLVQEQRIILLGSLDKPSHRLEDVVPGWDAPWITLVVCEDDHILLLIPKPSWSSVFRWTCPS